jgi:predicted HTH transcriptional regulator
MNTHNIIHRYIRNDIVIRIVRFINKKFVRYIIMNAHSKTILDLIKKEKIVTSSEVAGHLGVSWNTAEKYLLELVIDGKITKIKKVGVNLWILQ